MWRTLTELIMDYNNLEMTREQNFLTPDWPKTLGDVDIFQARFLLDFSSPCVLQPADFLRVGRGLRACGRHITERHERLDSAQWEALFQPPPSEDPFARRRFQKPAPAFVMKLPLLQDTAFDAGDRLACDVTFVGQGIPLLELFLRSLSHLGHLGIAAGKGHFEVSAVRRAATLDESPVWRHNKPLDSLACTIQPLSWLVTQDQIPTRIKLVYETPARLLVSGKPLRTPDFNQIFPFMLRRVTAMLYTHAGVEVLEQGSDLLATLREVETLEKRLVWCDWRSIGGQTGLSVGGFTGTMTISGRALEKIYWVLAVASLLGIGKGASHGAGHFILEH